MSGTGWFLNGLQLLFIGLKLAHVGEVAEWSWWWVFSPTWISLAVALGLVLLYALLKAIL